MRWSEIREGTAIAANKEGERPRNPNLNDAFRKWFGASQVVDDQGQPLMVFHGTKGNISKFDLRGKFRTGGKAFFFTPDPVFAELYARKGGDAGSRIYPVYLRIINMFENTNPSHMETLASQVDRFLEREALKPYGKGQSFYPFTKKAIFDGILKGNWDSLEHSIIIEALQKAGFDGAILQEGPHSNYMVFKATQIKSVFNTGAWDMKNPHLSETSYRCM